MAGYFSRIDLTDQAIHDGWLDSGDLGFIEDDELFVCGRHKDVIVVRGANHAPEEFEAALELLPGVRTGCAVAVGFVPAGEEDEALAMLVETTTDAPSTLADDVASRVQERTRIRPAHVALLAAGHAAAHQQRKADAARGAHPVAGGHAVAPKKVSARGCWPRRPTENCPRARESHGGRPARR
jgi:acyl-CoA synthetase (AMP-forming)/AMP-acid ligase II